MTVTVNVTGLKPCETAVVNVDIVPCPCPGHRLVTEDGFGLLTESWQNLETES